MVDIVKVKNAGVEVYPQTHAKAVLGLSTITGPQGPKGDTGATGATGPQGIKGDVGAAGATGPIGTQGPAGNNTITFEKVGTV